LFIDPGTTAYGVPAHYDWFKHTYSHNTVCLNGKDQPPADGKRIQYRKESWGSWVESLVNWADEEYRMKSAIVLPPDMCSWDETAYRGAAIHRINAITDDALLDIVKVSVPDKRAIELLYHMSSRLAMNGEWLPFVGLLSGLDQQWFYDKWGKPFVPEEALHWSMSAGMLEQAGWCSEPSELILADMPDNPPNRSRQSLIHRVTAHGAQDVLFVHAFAYALERAETTSGPLRGPSLEGSLLELNVRTAEEGALQIALRTEGCSLSLELELEWRTGGFIYPSLIKVPRIKRPVSIVFEYMPKRAQIRFR